MSATIKDIAKRTGLGIATISKFLNGGHVLDKNRIAIEQAITELDFRVNEFARGLKTSRSKTIGVLIPELRENFCTDVVAIVEDILRKAGYGILVSDCRSDKKLESEAMEFLVGKMVDGIINIPVSQTGEHLKLPLSRNLPVVLIDRTVEGMEADAVLIDNAKASQMAVNLLFENGHRSIAAIFGAKNTYTARHRMLGFKQAYCAKDLKPDYSLVEYGNYTVEGGYECMKKLIARRNEFTAVYVTNYDMTLGAVIALNEMGVKIPEELSFIGFDNLEVSHVVNPRLAIVYQPIHDIAYHAAQMMIDRLNKPGRTGVQTIMLSANICKGNSIASI